MSGVLVEQGEILVVSPHPDDEIIGAGATLIQLREAGWHVVNLAVGLGRREQHDRRRAEVEAACRRADFELIIPEEPAEISSKDDMEVAQAYLAWMVTDLLVDRRPDVVVTPSVHDAHHGHEVVARAVRDSLSQAEQPVRWWMYGLWGDLPFPTIYSPFGRKTMEKVIVALEAHTGEIDRNNYPRFVLGRAMMNAMFGSEKVFGHGTKAVSTQPYADLLTDLTFVEGRWIASEPHVLDPASPLSTNKGKNLTKWVKSPSWYQIIREENRR